MGKIKALAWVHVVLNGGLLALGLIVGAGVAMDDPGNNALPLYMWLLFWMSVFLFIPGLVGGIGLLSLQWWARVLMIILSLMLVVLVPIGTILGGFGLWILLGHEAQVAFGDAAVKQHQENAARGDVRTAEQTATLLAIFAGVGAGFVVVLGAGFMISGDPAPAELMSLFYPAIGVLLVVLAFAARRFIPGLR